MIRKQKASKKWEMLKDNNSENENETEVNLDPPTKTEI